MNPDHIKRLQEQYPGLSEADAVGYARDMEELFGGDSSGGTIPNHADALAEHHPEGRIHRQPFRTNPHGE